MPKIYYPGIQIGDYAYAPLSTGDGKPRNLRQGKVEAIHRFTNRIWLRNPDSNKVYECTLDGARVGENPLIDIPDG